MKLLVSGEHEMETITHFYVSAEETVRDVIILELKVQVYRVFWSELLAHSVGSSGDVLWPG